MWFSILCVVIALALIVVLLSINDSVGNGYLLNALTTITGGPLGGLNFPKVHLVQAPFTPGVNVDLSTSTEATFDGYVAKSLTGWTISHLNGSGNAVADGMPMLTWVPTGSTTPNTIAGWIMVDQGGLMVANGGIVPNVVLHGGTTTLSLVVGISSAPGQYAATILP